MKEKIKQNFKWYFLGSILLFVAGVVITKFTVNDLVALNDSEKECKNIDFWMLYDNPIERLSIGWLGKTAVVEKIKPTREAGFVIESEEKNILLIKAYTLFRIPVGKSGIQCGGSSYKIPQTQEAIEQVIKNAQYCEAKNDCTQIESKCPFGCYTFVNKNEAEKIQTFIDSYESRCMYICVQIEGYDCINNKCEVLYSDRGVNRDILYENCAREIPREKIDDTTLNQFEKIVIVWWWDEELQDNVELKFPYEPETGFAGCSESVKGLLRHLQETHESIDSNKN